MFKNIANSFSLTNKHIVLATPLILFSLLSSLYIIFSISGNIVALSFAIILFFAMLSAFLSGWFFMIKKIVKYPERENQNEILKDFPEGVGEYILPVTGMIVISCLVILLFISISYLIGMKTVGALNIAQDALAKAMSTPENMKSFLLSLTDEQFIRLQAWNLIMLVTMAIGYFSILFYAPSLFFKDKNPLKAYGKSLKDLLSAKFFKNLFLYVFLFIVYFFVSFITTIFAHNTIMHFICTLINFYFLVFVAVAIFNYYYHNYVKIGGIVDEVI